LGRGGRKIKQLVLVLGLRKVGKNHRGSLGRNGGVDSVLFPCILMRDSELLLGGHLVLAMLCLLRLGGSNQMRCTTLEEAEEGEEGESNR
jgi:hypothetical protein